jgi:uncharacterized membrane protein
MKRLIELDVLRAVLLLMMVVKHSPSQLRRFTDQPLGFFTTAEAFVFVSAFLAGTLFRRRAEKVATVFLLAWFFETRSQERASSNQELKKAGRSPQFVESRHSSGNAIFPQKLLTS